MRKKQWKIYLERSLASGLPFKELVHEIVWVTVVEGSVGLGEPTVTTTTTTKRNEERVFLQSGSINF